jgi:REP element-mobilizing transposase RayT
MHVFFELPVKLSVADQMRMLKASSSKWINDNKYINGKFQWQAGYGAFTYSRSQRDKVINYIINQEEHHKKITFREEYIDLLSNFKIKFDNRFLYEFYE